MELSSGDVVCKKDGPGMTCSAIAWCTEDRCITSGDYAVGDAIYGCNIKRGVKPEQVAVVDRVIQHEKGSPRDASLAILKKCPGTTFNAFKNRAGKSIRPQVNANYEALSTNTLQVEATEPVSGKVTRVSGYPESTRRVLPPSDDIYAVNTQIDKLESYHQGAPFRLGNIPVCIFTGFLKTEKGLYAACYSTKSLCGLLPEFCVDK